MRIIVTREGFRAHKTVIYKGTAFSLVLLDLINRNVQHTRRDTWITSSERITRMPHLKHSARAQSKRYCCQVNTVNRGGNVLIFLGNSLSPPAIRLAFISDRSGWLAKRSLGRILRAEHTIFQARISLRAYQIDALRLNAVSVLKEQKSLARQYDVTASRHAWNPIPA